MEGPGGGEGIDLWREGRRNQRREGQGGWEQRVRWIGVREEPREGEEGIRWRGRG